MQLSIDIWSVFNTFFIFIQLYRFGGGQYLTANRILEISPSKGRRLDVSFSFFSNCEEFLQVNSSTCQKNGLLKIMCECKEIHFR